MAHSAVTFFSVRRILTPLFTVMLLLASNICGYGETVSSQKFPRYDALSANVLFWEKIYSHYSLTEAVIHDSKDLSKIYDVIHLLDKDLPGATRFNRIFQKHAKSKYQKILKNLTVSPPQTKDEKRVAALFTGKERLKDLEEATENVRSQRGQKERFQNGVIHSGRYMKEIKRIFRGYHLPEELAYLPHVESSFNYKAYSKHGAAGIWQFTKGTGKQYLTINRVLDERLDPILASHAAARYLKNSYRDLKSWPLALTSYNYGLAGMRRAVEEQGDFVGIFNNYNKGHFKFASRNFYAEFLAALKVAQTLEKNQNLALDSALSNRYFKLRGYVHIKKVHKHFGLTFGQIKTLNPALRSTILRGEKYIPKGYPLRLVAGQNTNKLLENLPDDFYLPHQKKLSFHRVKKGETAGSIARQHGVSLKSLVRVNKLNKHATIYLNQKLKIPSSTKVTGKSSKSSSTSKQNKYIPAGEPPTLIASKKRHPSQNGHEFLPQKESTVYNVYDIYKNNGRTYGYITVQPSESLGKYEEWLGLQKGSLAPLNNLRLEAGLSPGQQILLSFDQLPPNIFEEKRLDFLQEKEEDFFSSSVIIGQKIYQVISGDTLWDICYNKFNIPLWLLERYNQTIGLGQLDRKQQLVIPIVQPI